MTYLWEIIHDFNYTSPGFLTLIRVVTNCDRCVTDYTYLVRHRDPKRRRWYWPLERPRHWKTPLCYRCPCPEIEPGQQGEVPGPSHTVYRGSSLRNRCGNPLTLLRNYTFLFPTRPLFFLFRYSRCPLCEIELVSRGQLSFHDSVVEAVFLTTSPVSNNESCDVQMIQKITKEIFFVCPKCTSRGLSLRLKSIMMERSNAQK